MSNLMKESKKTIVGVSILTSNQDSVNTIPALWGKFYTEDVAKNIPAKLTDDVYAVYTDFENEGVNNDGEYKFLIGVEVSSVDNIDGEHDVVTIPQGNYVKFEVPEENPEQVFPTWQRIWSNNDIGKTFACDFEKYSSTGDISINVGSSQQH